MDEYIQNIRSRLQSAMQRPTYYCMMSNGDIVYGPWDIDEWVIRQIGPGDTVTEWPIAQVVKIFGDNGGGIIIIIP